MRIKNVVKVMNFHSLLRVDASKRQAESYRNVGEEITKIIKSIVYNKNLVLDKKVILPDPKMARLNIYIANDYGFCGNFNSQIARQIKEDINEDLFKDYIEAVSNEAISWEGIREQLVKYHGFRYVPKSELEESKVREIKFDGIGKWVLGSPLCLNFTHLDKIPSFYNPEGARGEDAFFSTWLENSKVIEMPVYHFHDAFLKYTNILNEKYPKKLRKIKMEDEQTTERFIKASIGWIRYKPLFIYLTDRKNYNEKIDQIREKLRISIPEVNKLFANSDLNLLLPELEKFNSSVKKDYDDYIKTDEAWKKVKKAMTENK